MTLDEIRAEVERIRGVANDYEVAHGWEDDLHQSVLAAIRDGTCEAPPAAAMIALTTRDIDFARYCA